MHHIIHGGGERIGGMCIEVGSDDGTRVLLDLGMPLCDANHEDFPRDTQQRPTRELVAEKVLPNVAALYADDPAAPAFAAIILTHAHLDHYGLARHAHPDIPVYGSRGTIALLDVGRIFFPDAALPGDLRELPEDGPLLIGSLAITAIPVDHAAPDSRPVRRGRRPATPLLRRPPGAWPHWLSVRRVAPRHAAPRH